MQLEQIRQIGASEKPPVIDRVIFCWYDEGGVTVTPLYLSYAIFWKALYVKRSSGKDPCPDDNPFTICHIPPIDQLGCNFLMLTFFVAASIEPLIPLNQR
jgi:hypothetical protein